ncbi:unnamed protein product [Menidia menidia]|uniref:Collagen alpha-1(IX) chain n=1 Tax=Menidia menidia TaxID=238744 RepID=A0A8S4ASV3_9TELE|nr:unnamed protein product [Menidia menidia]
MASYRSGPKRQQLLGNSHLSVVLLSLLLAPAFGQLDLNRLDGDTVCPTMRNGQDDLPGFDLITQFQLDVIPLKGVRKVDGSTPLQVAYRLDREANFQIPTMLNFPRGFPDEYSFMTTFRMIKNTVNKVWNVWQIVDEDGNKQAGLRLNGDQQALEYFLMGADGTLQTVTFPGLSVLFNTKWHKVMIGVEREQVTLYVDCQPVDQKPIKDKGPINTEGDTLIGRLDSDPEASVVFELQWMLIHCDPKRAQRESCNELPATEVQCMPMLSLTDQFRVPRVPPALRAPVGLQEKMEGMEEMAAKGRRERSAFLVREAFPDFQELLVLQVQWVPEDLDFLASLGLQGPLVQPLKDLLVLQEKQEFQETKETSDLRARLDPEEGPVLLGLLVLLVHQGLWDRLVPAMRGVGKLVLLPARPDPRGYTVCRG